MNSTSKVRFSLTLAATLRLLIGSLASAQTHTPLADPIPAAIPASGIKFNLEPVTSELVAPTWGTHAPGDDDHLYVLDQTGQIWSISLSDDDGGSTRTLFLDVSKRLVSLGLGPAKYDERGLLGLAFHPDFRKNGLFYTFTSEPVTAPADFSTLPPGVAPNCQSVITEWRVKGSEDHGRSEGHGGSEGRSEDHGGSVDMGSARVVMRIDKPQFNHNGGALVFGSDNMLYISLGDGGGANDSGVGHAPNGNAQTLTPGNVLGKILRIDPLGRNSANGKYGIPANNPFFLAANSAPKEILAYGLRNPFRMSFDTRTGMLWAGDVGQNDIEEVDVIRSGGNYGWPIKEGTFLFDTSLPGRAGVGFVFQNSPGSPAGLIDPVAEYDHTQVTPAGLKKTRLAIVGGFVYRGHEINELKGRYLFGDYAGNLFVLNDKNQVEELFAANKNPLGLSVLAFAQDADGELYLLANRTGTLLKDPVTGAGTGVVLKFTPVER